MFFLMISMRQVTGLAIILFGWWILFQEPPVLQSARVALGVEMLSLAIFLAVTGAIYGFIDLPAEWLFWFVMPTLFYLMLEAVHMVRTWTPAPATGIWFVVLTIFIIRDLRKAPR